MDALPGSRFREEAALVDPDTNELLFPPRPSSAENPSPEPQDHFALSDPSSAPSSQPSSRTGSSTSSSGFEGLQYPRLPAFGPELPADVDRASRRFVGLVVVPGQYIVGIGVQGMPVPELRADGR